MPTLCFQGAMSANRTFYLLLTAIVVFFALVYSTSLTFAYVYDDRLLFIANPALRMGWESLANVGMPIIQGTTYFRPVVLSTFVAEFTLFDAVPAISKGINLALHLANCVLLALLVRRSVQFAVQGVDTLRRSFTYSSLPIVAVLFYATHPSLIESVAWVSGRFDLLVTLFSLSTILVAMVPTIRLGRRLLICLLLALALLSKEMAATLPILVVLFRAATCNQLSWLSLRAWYVSERNLLVSMFVVCALYVALRAYLFPQLVSADTSITAATTDPFARLTFVAQTFAFYMKLFVYPYRDTNLLHPYDLTTLQYADFSNTASMFVLAVAFVAVPAAAFFARKSRLWLACATFVSLLPVLNIAPLRLGGSIGENRFLTLPLALLVCAAAVAVAHYGVTHTWRRIPAFAGIGFVTLLVVFNVFFVRATLPIWRDDVSLFASTFDQFPNHDRAALHYLRASIQAGESAKALQNFESRLLSNEISVSLLPAYATALALSGRKSEAAVRFEQALSSNAFEGVADFEFEALLGYVGVLQAWGELNDAEKRLAQIRVARDIRKGVEDNYLVTMLELRQMILTGDDSRGEYDAKLAELKLVTTPEARRSGLASLRSFKGQMCRTEPQRSNDHLCGSMSLKIPENL
jgi:protein O-mannosyl-transferase